MGGFDWIIAAIFLVSILVGIFRGFIKESLSLISWILSVWLAFTFCTEAGEFINQTIHIPSLRFRAWAGFAAVFIGTLFVFAIISYAIAKLFVRGPIKGVDRVLGIGFGALRAVAIVVALLIFLRGWGFDSSEWWQNSKHIAKFQPAITYVEGLFPNIVDDGDAGESATQKAVQGIIEEAAGLEGN